MISGVISCLLFLPLAIGSSLQSATVKDPGRVLVAGRQIIVASTNALHAFDLDALDQGSPYLSVDTSATSQRIFMCSIDVSDGQECSNFPKVLSLVPNRTDIFLYCGTNAYQPHCEYRSLANISIVLPPNIPGSPSEKYSYCPFSRGTSNLADYSSDGEFYAATSMQPGMDYAWFKLNKLDDKFPVRTIPNEEFISNDAVFSKMFEDEYHAYLAFRETGLEEQNVQYRTVVSRLARVCKNDTGTGPLGLVHRYSFLSFLKARLLCTTQSGYSYNELATFSDPFPLNNEAFVMGIFNNIENGPPASAICLYKLADIQTAFSSGKKRGALDASVVADNTNNCANMPDQFDALKYSLLVNPIQQNGYPVEVDYLDSASKKYRSLFVLRDVPYGGKTCVLIFIGTDNGKLQRALACDQVLQKMSDIDIDSSGPITEITAYEPDDKFQTKLIVLSKSKVTSFLVYGCSYSEQSDCVSDLVCGWNCESKECVRRPPSCTDSSCDNLKISSGSCPMPPTDPPLRSDRPLVQATRRPFTEDRLTERLPTGFSTEGPSVQGLTDNNNNNHRYSVSVIIGVGVGCGIGAALIGLLLGYGLARVYQRSKKEITNEIASESQVEIKSFTPKTERKNPGGLLDKQDLGVECNSPTKNGIQ